MIAYRITVFGKVQGVFYRASTKNEADDMGINGWVRNEPDGSVLIHAEGEEMSMNAFIEWCKEGPQFANVLSVKKEMAEPEGFRSFEVRH